MDVQGAWIGNRIMIAIKKDDFNVDLAGDQFVDAAWLKHRFGFGFGLNFFNFKSTCGTIQFNYCMNCI